MPWGFSQGFDLGYEIWTGGPIDGSISWTYVDDASASHEFLTTLPNFGYLTRIEMPIDIVELDSGKWSTRDEGETYDKRSCECSTFVNATMMETMMGAFRDSTKARARTVVIELNTSSGFFPFGADKGDVGPWTVDARITPYGIGQRPYKYFRLDMVLTNRGVYPAIADVHPDTNGRLRFTDFAGTPITTYFKYPDLWMNPTTKYGVNSALLMGQTNVEYVDRGQNSDIYTTEFTIRGNSTKFARFLKSITGTVRATTMDMYTGTDCYPFGIDNNVSSATVRLLNPTLEVTHVGYKDFQMPISLGRTSDVQA